MPREERVPDPNPDQASHLRPPRRDVPPERLPAVTHHGGSGHRVFALTVVSARNGGRHGGDLCADTSLCRNPPSAQSHSARNKPTQRLPANRLPQPEAGSVGSDRGEAAFRWGVSLDAGGGQAKSPDETSIRKTSSSTGTARRSTERLARRTRGFDRKRSGETSPGRMPPSAWNVSMRNERWNVPRWSVSFGAGGGSARHHIFSLSARGPETSMRRVSGVWWEMRMTVGAGIASSAGSAHSMKVTASGARYSSKSSAS